MEDLILLGQIPGTSIHITFGSWLALSAVVLLTIALAYRRHGHHVSLGISHLLHYWHKRRLLKHFDQIAL